MESKDDTIPTPLSPPQQGIRERSCALISGFTPKGGVATIANQLCIVARILVSAKSELSAATVHGDYAHPSAFVVNGMLVSAATSLQNVLEAVASLCHHLQPDSDHQGDVYFSAYPFSVSAWEFIAIIKRTEINPLKFRGQSFNDLANSLKHELPWIGIISEVDHKHDVYDETGVGVLRGLLLPMYTIARKLVTRIGQTSIVDKQTGEGVRINQPVELPLL